jgi:hypothetical protein
MMSRKILLPAPKKSAEKREQKCLNRRIILNFPIPGPIGFDRMAAVTVACPGRLLGPVNNVGKTSTANNSDVSGRVGFNAPLAMAA